MDQYISAFITEVDPIALAKEEENSGNFWSVFEPFVRLLYVPDTPLPTSGPCSQRASLVSKLQLSSISSVLTALHTIILCSDDGHRSLDVMQRENLLPYIITAPMHVPLTLKIQAIELVCCLGRFKTIEPPTLIDLAKANLAKYQFGLERLLHLESPHELVHEYYSSHHF